MLSLGTAVNRGGFVSADPLLLDKYSGASAAYSLRKLSNSYSGNCVTVRRDSDNQEANIGFSGGVLDTSALASHCGSANGFVATWFDQSSNARNATQSTTSKQPKIYDASSGLVLDDSNKPTLSFDADDMELANEIFLRSNTPDAFLISIVAEGRESGATNGEYFTGHTQAALNFLSTEAGSGVDRFTFRHTDEADTGNINLRFAFNADVVAGEMALLNLYVESSTKKMQFNGQQLTGTGTSSWSNTNGYKLNIRTIGRGYAVDLNLKYSELIIWANQGSTDLSGIQSNINTFYSIY